MKANAKYNSNIVQIGKQYNIYGDEKSDFCNNCTYCKKYDYKSNNKNHCNNLNNINDEEKYICFEHENNTRIHGNKPYILSDIVINEGLSELGTNTYKNCKNPCEILSNDFDLYLVLGEGGIGKSFFLNKLYDGLIENSARNNKNIIPFFLNCDYYGNSTETQNPKDWIYSYINSKFNNLDLNMIIQNQYNQIYFIVDSINSIQYNDQNDFENKVIDWANFVKEFCAMYPNVFFIISSRRLSIVDYFDMRRQKRVFLQPFDKDKILTYIENNVPNAKTKNDLRNLIETYKDIPFIGIPFFLSKLISFPKSNKKIKSKTDIVLLYFKYLLEDHYSNRTLIKYKLKYNNNICFYDLKYNGNSFFETLFKCAFMCQEKNKMILTEDDILNEFSNDISQLLSIAVEEKILKFDSGIYEFYHPILQEFCASIYILNKLNNDNAKITSLDNYYINIEVVEHIYNLITDKSSFINILMNNGQLTLAAECVVHTDGVLNRMVSDTIVKKLNENLNNLEIVNTLGLYLGKCGDPRFKISKKYIEPPCVTVENLSGIKIAKYPVTNKEFEIFINDGGYSNIEYWNDTYSNMWFDYNIVFKSMIDFWLSIRNNFEENPEAFQKFCINNSVNIEQCACLASFLNMTDCELSKMIRDIYNEEKHKKPLQWDNPAYNNPSQPVVGISLYEAKAYCNWLSSKTNKKYRLLTNSEWEKMARSKRRKYIFNDDSNINVCCNTSESKLKRVLPVGVISCNKTPEGIYDINGNIYEWTSSLYNNTNNNFDSQYIVKGGSWVQSKDRATSAYIGRAKSWCRNIDLGFRMCLDENN